MDHLWPSLTAWCDPWAGGTWHICPGLSDHWSFAGWTVSSCWVQLGLWDQSDHFRLEERKDRWFNRGEKASNLTGYTESRICSFPITRGKFGFLLWSHAKSVNEVLQLDASVQCMLRSDIKEHTLNCLDASLCLMSGRFKALCEAGAFCSEISWLPSLGLICRGLPWLE